MRLLAFVYLSAFSLASYAFEKTDSLIPYHKLYFYTPLEQKNFDLLLQGNVDYFNLLSCVNPSIDSATISRNNYYFDAVIKSIESSGVSTKKHSKQIKVIYNSIHNTFFDKYELQNSFTDIFDAGKYNCVSATGLYAIAFERLNIPYQIKEKPTHVYLIAYPNEDRIIVEATNPANGYIAYNDGFKRAFVEEMKKMKMVSASDAKNLSYEAIFNKYFYKDENINLQQLVAIQYHNDGLYQLEKEKFERAFRQFQKSYYLYPSERATYAMYLAASSHLSLMNPTSKEYADFITEMAIFTDFGVTDNEIIGEFINVTNVWLFQKSDTVTYNQIYRKFATVYDDSLYVKNLDFIYYYEYGRYFTQIGRKEKALSYIKKAYETNPTNVQAQAFLIQLIADKVARLNGAPRILAYLEKNREDTPSLMQNPNFTDMLLHVYLQMAHKSFYENNGKKGTQFLDDFEALYAKVDESDVNENAIGIAYSSSATYYYRKGYKTKARELLKKGLEFSPENQILKDRLRYLN